MDFNTVTDILNTWLTSKLKATVDYKAGKNDIIHINANVLQLEHWLLEWRKDQKLNERIDASIVSDNILRLSAQSTNESAFQALDYQFNFLYFLARHYSPKADLYVLINNFVEKYKDQFSFADIVITNTGATRCKTNIRFAILQLRRIGMILGRDVEGKRSWSPSIPGLVALLNIEYQVEKGNSEFMQKSEDKLGRYQEVNNFRGYPYDGIVYSSIQMFKQDGYLYEFLQWLRAIKATDQEKKFIEEIINSYIAFTSSAIEIKEEGLKLTKDFKKRSEQFQLYLFENHQRNIPFMTRLLSYFRAPKQDRIDFGNN